jgi:hypothetical protein
MSPTTGRGRAGVALGLLGVSALLLAACSPQPSTPGIEDETLSIEQSAAISDGEVSADEYEAGFQRYRACLQEAGYELLINGEDNDTIQYGVPDAAVTSGADERCYVGEFQEIDRMWQLAREDTSHSAQVLKDCLTANGITPEDTMEELIAQLQTANIPLESCAVN